MLLISLTVSAGKNTVAASDNDAYDIYEESERLVALTFDDGPKAGKTEALLDMLKEKGVHATFFMIGAQVEENGDIVQRVYEEGHQIGIHTYSHVDLSTLSETQQREEIEKCREAIAAITGNGDCLVRPPYGRTNSVLENWLDTPMILWSIDTEDWTGKSAEQIIQETLRDVRDGDIILMHDISDNGLEAAAGIIDELQRLGYTFVTVDQLFAYRNVEPEDGEAYRYVR
jgi:peptidoglycan/xylan/chitin deacetylase (PgdA/CDA1 family)